MTRWTTLEGYRDPTAGAAMTEVEIKGAQEDKATAETGKSRRE